MNFLNMFSDEAPISNSGYRSSLYTDPSIMQGIDFLNNEKDIAKSLSDNLTLISQTDGSNLGSGKILNGKIFEGLTTSQLSAPGSTPTTPEPVKELEDQLKDADIEILELSYMFVNSMYEEALESVTKDYQGGIASVKLAGTEPSWNYSGYKGYSKYKTSEQTSSDGTYYGPTSNIWSDSDCDNLKNITSLNLSNCKKECDNISTCTAINYNEQENACTLRACATKTQGGEQRQEILKGLQIIQSSLSNISVQVSDIVQKRSKVNIKEYYDVMNKIKETKYKIIETNNKIIELTNIVDPVSAVAEREETHILSKQRYYMYIFWFIVAAVVIYVMVANMVDPNSSFNVLVICIIILIGIFGFMIYDKVKTSWYYSIENGIKKIHVPRLDNVINFDPLVSIKYTS
jgi:hypothetical protein